MRVFRNARRKENQMSGTYSEPFFFESDTFVFVLSVFLFLSILKILINSTDEIC
jgi:hypothetical protein